MDGPAEFGRWGIMSLFIVFSLLSIDPNFAPDALAQYTEHEVLSNCLQVLKYFDFYNMK